MWTRVDWVWRRRTRGVSWLSMFSDWYGRQARCFVINPGMKHTTDAKGNMVGLRKITECCKTWINAQSQKEHPCFYRGVKGPHQLTARHREVGCWKAPKQGSLRLITGPCCCRKILILLHFILEPVTIHCEPQANSFHHFKMEFPKLSPSPQEQCFRSCSSSSIHITKPA